MPVECTLIHLVKAALDIFSNCLLLDGLHLVIHVAEDLGSIEAAFDELGLLDLLTKLSLLLLKRQGELAEVSLSLLTGGLQVDHLHCQLFIEQDEILEVGVEGGVLLRVVGVDLEVA